MDESSERTEQANELLNYWQDSNTYLMNGVMR